MTYITVKLTEDQRNMIVQRLQTHYVSEDYIVTRHSNPTFQQKLRNSQEFLRRTIETLAKAKS